MANAGHEPPLVHNRDGSFTPVPASSPPLGILQLDAGNDGISNLTLKLDGGSLYVFTDGVTEGILEDGSRLGVEGFQDIIRERADLPLQDRLDAVVSVLNDTGRKRHDDITLLAVNAPSPRHMNGHATGSTDLLVRHTFQARAEALHEVRGVVSQACEACGCSHALATDLIIAVGEACQNVVRHAYKDTQDGEATLEIHCKGGIIEFRLQDSAPLVDRDKLKPEWPEDPGSGGMGICLIHDIMDEVEYLPLHPGHGNLLRMAKHIERDSNDET